MNINPVLMFPIGRFLTESQPPCLMFIWRLFDIKRVVILSLPSHVSIRRHFKNMFFIHKRPQKKDNNLIQPTGNPVSSNSFIRGRSADYGVKAKK